MAGYIGSKGSGIISGIDASIADLNLTDKALANGTTEANKVLTADANKDVTAIRNLTATGDVTASGSITSTGATITGAVKPTTYQETYVANSTGATTTLDLATGTSFSVTLSENTQFAFTLPTLPSDTAFSFTLFVTQPSSAKTIAWPGSVDWAGGSAPDAPGDSEVNGYGFFTRDGGTTYYGFLGGAALG